MSDKLRYKEGAVRGGDAVFRLIFEALWEKGCPEDLVGRDLLNGSCSPARPHLCTTAAGILKDGDVFLVTVAVQCCDNLDT